MQSLSLFLLCPVTHPKLNLFVQINDSPLVHVLPWLRPASVRWRCWKKQLKRKLVIGGTTRRIVIWFALCTNFQKVVASKCFFPKVMRKSPLVECFERKKISVCTAGQAAFAHPLYAQFRDLVYRQAFDWILQIPKANLAFTYKGCLQDPQIGCQFWPGHRKFNKLRWQPHFLVVCMELTKFFKWLWTSSPKWNPFQPFAIFQVFVASWKMEANRLSGGH